MPLRLAKFRVFGLFGQFDYDIPLRLEEHVTAIIAPNGIGKTLCLRMINAFFRQKWTVFNGINFDYVEFEFTNSQIIRLRWIDDGAAEAAAVKLNISIELILNGSVTFNWRPKFSEQRKLASIERSLPFLTRMGGDRWRSDYTGEVLSFSDIVELYADQLPNSTMDTLFGSCPDWLSTIVNNIDCRLIETQRLLILRDRKGDQPAWASRGPSGQSTLAIDRKSQIIKTIIASEISQYASVSQTLDRSFPRRVISNTFAGSETDLEKRLAELDKKRIQLMEAGILDPDTEAEMAFPEGPFEPAISRVLSVYASDVDQKLSILSPLLEKIKLFKMLIDKRFLTKDVRITKSDGLSVSFNDRNIPLQALSSGEQHQLVLFFEMLFEIRPNSLILIDEPELSLHVSWQKNFIKDLMSIIELNKFDVILATHSPQLIGRWNRLVVELGDVDIDDPEDTSASRPHAAFVQKEA